MNWERCIPFVPNATVSATEGWTREVGMWIPDVQLHVPVASFRPALSTAEWVALAAAVSSGTAFRAGTVKVHTVTSMTTELYVIDFTLGVMSGVDVDASTGWGGHVRLRFEAVRLAPMLRHIAAAVGAARSLRTLRSRRSSGGSATPVARRLLPPPHLIFCAEAGGRAARFDVHGAVRVSLESPLVGEADQWCALSKACAGGPPAALDWSPDTGEAAVEVLGRGDVVFSFSSLASGEAVTLRLPAASCAAALADAAIAAERAEWSEHGHGCY